MISLIIATWNGATTLERTLEAMTRLEAPDSGHEIIVVDNASTDGSAALIDRFMDRLSLTYMYEARRGKAYALNAAIETAKGDFLVFTDDDVILNPGFLRAYETAAKAQPDYGFFTGQIRLDWARKPPYWLEKLGAADMAYGSTMSGRPEEAVPWLAAKGANMAVRRDTLGDVRYRTEEGINYMGTGTGTGGVDSWFAHDATRESDIWFVPDACLDHMVRDHQIGIKPVFSRYVRIGISNYQADPTTKTLFARTIAGLPFPLTSRLIRAGAGGLYRLARGDTEAAARRMLTLADYVGRLKSWRKASKG
jgi:glycosyltransferase involved in cell wall biosynthesis